jgi:RNA polymerase primary sigma factor
MPMTNARRTCGRTATDEATALPMRVRRHLDKGIKEFIRAYRQAKRVWEKFLHAKKNRPDLIPNRAEKAAGELVEKYGHRDLSGRELDDSLTTAFCDSAGELLPVYVSRAAADDFRRLVELNLKLAYKTAASLGYGRDSDALQDSVIGLMRGAARFDPCRGFQFSTCAIWWIRNEIFRGLNQRVGSVRLPINVANRVRKIKKIEARELALSGDKPDEDRLRRRFNGRDDETDRGRSEIAAAQKAAHATEIISLDAPINSRDDGQTTLLDLTVDDADQDTNARRVETIDHERSLRALTLILPRLPPKERQIIELRFGLKGDSQTLAEIGQMMDLSRERIRQLEAKALTRLRKLMPPDDPDDSP